MTIYGTGRWVKVGDAEEEWGTRRKGDRGEKERRRGKKGGGGDAARRDPARAALSMQPVLGDRGPWAGLGCRRGRPEHRPPQPRSPGEIAYLGGRLRGAGRRHCPRNAAAPCSARSSLPARAASPAEPVPPALRSAAPRTTTPTMPRAPGCGEGATGRDPQRVHLPRVSAGGVREPRPTARQVRASGAGSSCFNRAGSRWVLPPASLPLSVLPLALLPVMDPTHTSAAPRTRGMKLQMEQPGRSVAPCSAWALPTGAVADLAPAHREAQSSQQRSVLSSSQNGKGLLSWAWGHRAASAQGSVGSEEQCMGVLGAWGGMPAHSPSVYVLEPTAFNPSMHLCHGLESLFLSRIHLSGLSQNPLALHPSLHCWWLRTHLPHPELPGSEPTPSFPGVPTCYLSPRHNSRSR